MTPVKCVNIASVFFLFTFFVACGGCGESRLESRQARLDSFRHVLPEDVRLEFDSIENEVDCYAVGELLEQSRSEDADLNAAVDSIMHAELIDCFSDTELVRFFWYYFDYSIERNDVPNP